MKRTSKRGKRGKRGRRKPKPLHKRSGPKFFGNGFKITLQDVRDIKNTLRNLSQQMGVSAQVKAQLEVDLVHALYDDVRTDYEKILILYTYIDIHNANLAMYMSVLNKNLKEQESCENLAQLNLLMNDELQIRRDLRKYLGRGGDPQPPTNTDF